MPHVNTASVLSQRGQRAFLSGEAAETLVELAYIKKGCVARARRWRGGGGELDLVFAQDDRVIFVEVKKSKTFASAAAALRPAQINRIMQAASVFIANLPNGQLTDLRFDVALVDQTGQTEIIENAYLAA